MSSNIMDTSSSSSSIQTNDEQQTNGELSDDENGLNGAQYLAFIMAIIFSSSISLSGSILIIRMLWRKLTKAYHRILFTISLVDVALSSSNLFHLVLVPMDKTGNPYAFGNGTTCSMVGFVLNVCMIAVSIYNAFLSVNFLMQIRYQWKDDQIKRWIEPFVHAAAAVLSLTLPVLAVSWRMMNPEIVSGLCMMVEYPNGCNDDEEVECINGADVGGLLGYSAAAIIYLFGFVGFGCTFGLYWTVRSTIKRNERFAADSTLSDRHKQRLRRVSWQCNMYALAYLNTIMWPAIHQILLGVWSALDDRPGDIGPFLLVLISILFFPLQGFFNMLVFVSPRYQLWRNALPEEPWTYVLRCTLSLEDPPTGRTSTTNFGSTTLQHSNHFLTSKRSVGTAPTATQ
mmetsp:Transcript_3751/g.10556  ORF Transcript_3751/g.10556 Transcript_3751/m.10556 type:complete len:399 (+) Transcript_3751:750-1946(+)